MDKLISFLDFLPGKKTLIGSLATSVVFLYALSTQKELPVTADEIVSFILIVASTTKATLSMGLTLYGLVMKFLRNFQ